MGGEWGSARGAGLKRCANSGDLRDGAGLKQLAQSGDLRDGVSSSAPDHTSDNLVPSNTSSELHSEVSSM